MKNHMRYKGFTSDSRNSWTKVQEEMRSFQFGEGKEGSRACAMCWTRRMT
ncbi:hypothetical protein C8D96_0331 [Kushneria marisflavi]|nr:hypothetical protein C8D96_0331 [Kushneria marisflavi]